MVEFSKKMLNAMKKYFGQSTKTNENKKNSEKCEPNATQSIDFVYRNRNKIGLSYFLFINLKSIEA